MIVNAYGLLAVFVALAETVGAGALVFVGVRALRAPRAGNETAAEATRPLLLLLTLFAGGLSLASLILWGLLLQSYVPQWEEVLCITGVLRVGTNSAGPAGWLPGLASATTALHGAVLVLGGAAAVAHLAGRNAGVGSLPRRHLAVLLLLALVAAGAAATQTAYVVIPKTEQFLASGCCTTRVTLAPQLGADLLGTGAIRMAAAAYAVPALALAAALAGPLPALPGSTALRDLFRVVGGVGVLLLGGRFVVGVVSPATLGLPLHHCVYCLVTHAPETLVGLALLVVPAASALWLAGARYLAGTVERSLERKLDRLAIAAALGAVAFFGTQWVLS